MKKTIIALALALASCASLADLRDFEDAARRNLEDFKAGLITEEEFRERDLALKEELTDSTEERIEEWGKAIQEGPITGNPLIDLVIGSIPTVVGGGYLLNRQRDQRRRKRGEPVDSPN